MNSIKSVRIVNSRNIELRFDLEPWGEQYKMQSGVNFAVVASAPLHGELEIEIQENRITVFGWSGSTVQIFQDGMEIGGSTQPVPPLPRK